MQVGCHGGVNRASSVTEEARGASGVDVELITARLIVTIAPLLEAREIHIAVRATD